MFKMTKTHKQTNRLGHKMLAALLTVVLIFVMLPSASAAELSGYGDTSVVNIINNGSGKYLNVGLGYDTNGNNIYQYTNDSSVEQKFRLKYYSANKCYFINAMCSSDGYDKGLSAVSTSSTSNVQLYSVSTSSTLQQWVFSYVGNGLYTISPYANSSLYLTAHNGSNGSRSRTATSGSNASGNVYVTTMNGTDETGDPTYGQYQLWSINALTHPNRAVTGYYKIKNVKSGMYISRDSSNNIRQHPESDDYMQTWYVFDYGIHHIPYAADSPSVYSFCASGSNGSVLFYDDITGNCFNFIKNYGEDTYRIASYDSSLGYVATVFLGSTEAGETIVHTTYTGADSQKWILEPVIPDGTYFIRNDSLTKLISIQPSGTNYNGESAVIGLDTPKGQDYQKWAITWLADKTYKIISVQSGLALTLNSDETVMQSAYTGAENQKWYIANICGNYIIRSKSSNSYLRRSGASQLTISTSATQIYDEWIMKQLGGANTIGIVALPDYRPEIDSELSGYDHEFFIANVLDFADGNGYKTNVYSGGDYTEGEGYSAKLNEIKLQMSANKIFTVLAHGSPQSIAFNTNTRLTVSDIQSTFGSTGLSECDLFLYTSCLTGATPENGGNNMVQQTYAAGAGCVIGWNRTIKSGEAELWTMAFFSSLENGYTIQEAIEWAMENAMKNYGGGISMTDASIVVLGDTSKDFAEMY